MAPNSDNEPATLSGARIADEGYIAQAMWRALGGSVRRSQAQLSIVSDPRQPKATPHLALGGW